MVLRFFTRKRLHAAFYAQRIFHRFQDRTNMRGIARRGDDEILRYIHQLPHLKHHDIGRLMLISCLRCDKGTFAC